MLEKAIVKLKSEMEKNKDNYIQIIGEYLLQYLKMHHEEAEKILCEGKTIAKSLDEMTNTARKKAVNGRAMLTDQEGYEIVLKYFGINVQALAEGITPVEKVINVDDLKPKELKAHVDFDVSLEDFI